MQLVQIITVELTVIRNLRPWYSSEPLPVIPLGVKVVKRVQVTKQIGGQGGLVLDVLRYLDSVPSHLGGQVVGDAVSP